VRNIDVQSANAARARAAIGTIDAELRSLRETFGKTAVTDLTEANDKAGSPPRSCASPPAGASSRSCARRSTGWSSSSRSTPWAGWSSRRRR
jgi:hypothetical protein